jgi:hypothetical protein
VNIILSAKNAMGLEAEYEVEVNCLLDLQEAVRKLYALPGIVRVTMPDDAIKKLDQYADEWEGF